MSFHGDIYGSPWKRQLSLDNEQTARENVSVLETRTPRSFWVSAMRHYASTHKVDYGRTGYEMVVSRGCGNVVGVVR